MCHSLSKINLTTTRDPEDSKNQIARFEELKRSLSDRSIVFDIAYSETLHDRRISYDKLIFFVVILDL